MIAIFHIVVFINYYRENFLLILYLECVYQVKVFNFIWSCFFPPAGHREILSGHQKIYVDVFFENA